MILKFEEWRKLLHRSNHVWWVFLLTSKIGFFMHAAEVDKHILLLFLVFFLLGVGATRTAKRVYREF